MIKKTFLAVINFLSLVIIAAAIAVLCMVVFPLPRRKGGRLVGSGWQAFPPGSKSTDLYSDYPDSAGSYFDRQSCPHTPSCRKDREGRGSKGCSGSDPGAPGEAGGAAESGIRREKRSGSFSWFK